jgi:hypothetical protein
VIGSFIFFPPGNLADNGHLSTKVLWKLNVLKSLLFLVESMQKLVQKKKHYLWCKSSSISNNVMASKLRREPKNITEVLQVSMH